MTRHADKAGSDGCPTEPPRASGWTAPIRKSGHQNGSRRTPRTQPFNVYLAHERVTDARACVLLHHIHATQELTVTGFDRATLYGIRRPAARPGWAALYDPHLDDPSIIGRNARCGTVLVLQTGTVFVLLTQGTGHHAVDKEAVVPSFGLRTAANLVDPDNLKSLDTAILTRDATQRREQASGYRELALFGLDAESDLLRALTGQASDARFGLRISGADSVKLCLGISLNEFAPLLQRILERYRSDAYRQGPLELIDHVRAVHAPSVIDALDNGLLDRLARREFDRVQLCAPEILDWQRVAGFRFSRAARAPSWRDPDIRHLVDRLSRGTLTIARLKRQKVYCVDDDQREVDSYTAYACLHAQVEHEGRLYVLFDRRWYAIDPTFAFRVQDAVRDIPDNPRPLPDYSDTGEASYNARVAGSSGGTIELLDQRLIRIPGAASSVEPCDLLRDGREFIHVKRGTRSQSLSHLFNQGLVSAELLLRSEAFRHALAGKAPSLAALAHPGAQPRPDAYEIVFAIVFDAGREAADLPFFAQLCLKRTVEHLCGMGYRVSLIRIVTTVEHRVTQRFEQAA